MQDYDTALQESKEYGQVTAVHYPLVIAKGLPGAQLDELVLFKDGKIGEVVGLERDEIEIMTFAQTPPTVSTELTRTNHRLEIVVHEKMLGTVVDPLGSIILHSESHQLLDSKWEGEKRALGALPLKLSQRSRISSPLQTGVSLVDMLLPLGEGQRELVVGDRKTGKSSFLLTTLKTQVKLKRVVIYAMIGKQWSEIKKMYSYVSEHNLTDKVIIVASSADDSPGLISRTPDAAMSIAEYFRDHGQSTLVILDDLSTHAKFYREVALLAKRFPGRDSYPGDIFYIHARLLERAGFFRHPEAGTVAISCLPVGVTVENDLTDYIVSNLIGITDGHLLFDSSEFSKGRRPAINVGLSVTRVGKQVQEPISRDLSRMITTFLNSYDKTIGLSHFGAELNDQVKDTLKIGTLLYSFFNQPFTESVGHRLQRLIIAMIWQRWLPELNEKDFIKMRKRIRHLIRESHKVALLFAQLNQSENLEAYLAKLTKHKEHWLKICLEPKALENPSNS